MVLLWWLRFGRIRRIWLVFTTGSGLAELIFPLFTTGSGCYFSLAWLSWWLAGCLLWFLVSGVFWLISLADFSGFGPGLRLKVFGLVFQLP